MPIIQLGARTLDLLQDVGCFGRPDEGLGGLIVMIDVVLDGHDEFFHVAEDATSDALVGKVAEETLHHVEPRTARRREVHVEPRVSCQPSLNLRMFVGGVVIRDQMDVSPAGVDVVDHA